MERKEKDLIAVGASFAAHCQPCLEYHIAQAYGSGACEEEIAEAIKIGKLVNKGASSQMYKFAEERVRTGRVSGKTGGCGCR